MRKATTAGFPFEILASFESGDEALKTILIVGRDEDGTVQAFQKIIASGSCLGWQQMNGSQVEPDSVPEEFTKYADSL